MQHSTRNIIEIDEALCDGCGNCVVACAEGAIEVIDGKARVVRDSLCDGLGACLGDCPQGALRIVQRETEAFDEAAVAAHLAERDAQPPQSAPGSGGGHGRGHGGGGHGHGHGGGGHGHGHGGGGCPGSRVISRPAAAAAPPIAPAAGAGLPAKVLSSDLAQWPVQLHLVPERAPFFQDKELVVLSTCGPVASADVHWRFLRGRALVMACPKLDVTGPYVRKLAGIFAGNGIPRVLVVRMQVPCCGGLVQMVAQARTLSGRTDLEVQEVVLGLDGSVVSERPLLA